jgi:tetratricopeptide (TPR) repeat protein/glycosyltransferase involved in cell wall biosynthesis
MEIVDNYQLAEELFQQKDFSAAQNILFDLLQEDQNDSDVLNFLGTIKLNLGEYSKAAGYLEKAISIYERHPMAHYNLGLCYQHFKLSEEARKHYKRAVELNPLNVDALINLGVVFQTQEDYDSAENYFNRASLLQPNSSKIFNNRGNLFFKKNELELAEKNYRKAISLEPDNPEFLFNLGNCCFQQGFIEDSIDLFKRTAELNPNEHLACINTGIAFFKLNKFKEAIDYFKIALANDPKNAEAHFNLGSCYRELKQYTAALECYEAAAALNPGNTSVFINIGNIYNQLGDGNKAKLFFDKVSNSNETKAIVFTNIGVSKMGQRLVDEASQYFNIALQFEPENPAIHYNNAHALLIKGNFDEGWVEYGWRKKRKEFFPREFSKPELKSGMDVNGKIILVYDEQGLGDTIQFVRYIPMLQKLGAIVIFECNKMLLGLLKEHAAGAKMIGRDRDKEPSIEYDYQIPLLSLPQYFNTTTETIISEVPYIYADSAHSKKMAEIIGNCKEFKIGIVWGGNPVHTGDSSRSCRLENFKTLLSVPNIKFYSLQKGSPLEQLENCSFPVTVLNEYIDTFMDTAAAIENLDLVITIDTSVAHLAGAMGKKTWLLLPFFPDWRWMLDRKDSPWYPTMKLFRQSEEGNWKSVLKEVETELREYVMTDGKNVPLKLSSQEKYVNVPDARDKQLILGLSGTGDYGWGVVNKYIKQEVSNKYVVKNLDENSVIPAAELANAKVFQLLRDLDFNPLYNVRGKENYGYTVFENELKAMSVINARNYDKIVTASTWNYQKLIDAEIKNAGLVIQGIDPKVFYPENKLRNNNLFIIFSGGKFELRKGQDLVLKAVSILQKKYRDIILINAWYNAWPETMHPMITSKYIRYEEKGSTWEEFMHNLCVTTGLDTKRVFTLPLVPNQKLRDIYLKSDLGLFPNRCEGGTNLVMMEYMACGKPVVASYNTGHKDVLTENNSILLKEMKEYKLYNPDNVLTADWEEPNLDEIIDKVEYAYNNRDIIKNIGDNAAVTMKNFTWSDTAMNLLKVVGL